MLVAEYSVLRSVSWKNASSRELLRAASSATVVCASSRPWPMTMSWSAVCATSLIRWLETSTVRPCAAGFFSRLRIHRMPSGSRPLTGSSSSSTAGSPSSAAATPSRCAMPRENLPARRPDVEAEVVHGGRGAIALDQAACLDHENPPVDLACPAPVRRARAVWCSRYEHRTPRGTRPTPLLGVGFPPGPDGGLSSCGSLVVCVAHQGGFTGGWSSPERVS